MTREEIMRSQRAKVIKHWENNNHRRDYITQYAREVEVTPETYRKYLREVGYDPKGVVFTYKCRRDFFNIIDTEQKAYWLGFIYADGNVSINRGVSYIMSLAISAVDEAHLNKFRRDIDTDIPIRYVKANFNGIDKPIIRLDISSKELCESLIDKECIPKKSLIKQFPSNVPLNLMNHFLRGYIDGNGSYYLTNNRMCVSVTSSTPFLEDFRAFVESMLKVGRKEIYHVDRKLTENNKKYGTYRLQGDEAKVFIRWLYKDATVYLDRKYEKVMSTINRAKSVKANRLKRRLIPR